MNNGPAHAGPLVLREVCVAPVYHSAGRAHRARGVASPQQPLHVFTSQAVPTCTGVASALRSASLGTVLTRTVNSWRESSTRGGQNAHDARTRKPHRLAESARCRVGSRGL